MSVLKIRKRNDEFVEFDRLRIEEAIELACNAVGEMDKSFIPVVTDFIVKDLDHVYTEVFVNRIPSVEDVQDIITDVLPIFDDIKFEYKALPDGAQIHYSTEYPQYVQALHEWFDAQMSEHGNAEIPEHIKHHSTPAE